jgi:non-homologous end joining protein Ku
VELRCGGPEHRNQKEYFDEIQEVNVTKVMLDLAKHIVNQKAADFDREKSEDRYEEALTELINAKRPRDFQAFLGPVFGLSLEQKLSEKL